MNLTIQYSLSLLDIRIRMRLMQIIDIKCIRFAYDLHQLLAWVINRNGPAQFLQVIICSYQDERNVPAILQNVHQFSTSVPRIKITRHVALA